VHQTVGSRQCASDRGQQAVGSRHRAWKRAAVSGKQAVGIRQRAAGSGHQTEGSRQWASDRGQQAVGIRQRAAGSWELTIDKLLNLPVQRAAFPS
jgi:hypothetical protein